MKNTPLISVIITTYNSSETIIETLESLARQTFTNYEVLIYDDYSVDDTLELISSFLAENIVLTTVYAASVNNGGPAAGRNWGCKNASGKYLCFLDADDVWTPEKLEVQFTLMEQSEFAACSSNAHVINGNSFKQFSGILDIQRQILRNKIILSSSMVRAQFIKEKKMRFNETKNYISVEDYDFFLNILLKGGSIFVIGEKLIYYRVIESSISHINFERNELKRLMVLQRLETKSMKLRSLIWIVRMIYLVKIKIWNSKY
jgi:teichuronic acid biosynthesis glycosyltransferase TuaG